MKQSSLIGSGKGRGGCARSSKIARNLKLACMGSVVLILSACGGKTIEPRPPVWVGKGANDLQGTICGTCGGLESKEDHKARQKRKRASAKDGTINTDIVEDNR